MHAVRWFLRWVGRGPHRLVVRQAVLALLVLGSASIAGAAIETQAGTQAGPVRLGFLEGDVLFWRPGAGDWEAAQVNIPLAAGDALATRDGKVELQIGGKSFIRVADATQLRLKSNEPDFLQLDVSAGHLALDVRDLPRGDTLEVDTPNAVVSIARDGYYRVDVDAESTHLIVRRGGQASVKPSGGSAADVATGEAVDIDGSSGARLTALAAPPFDDWDRWNYDRADRFLAAPRSYAVSPDIYGTDELEQNGDWRYVNPYGRVWAPSSVPSGWAPYSDGRWLWDPLYGWAWADNAPWGWAPFHYGRWVYPGYWAWAPGPVVGVPIYSPALVTFFGGPGFSVGFGVPFVSWVALGWGQPLFPWWGPVGFIGSPCWWGWGGPRIVNNIIINNGTVVHGNSNNFHRNMDVPGAVVSVPKDQFDTRSLSRARLGQVNASELKPVNGPLPVSSKGGSAGVGSTPPKMPAPNLNTQRAMADVHRNGAAPGTNLSRQAPQSLAGGARSAGSALSTGSKSGATTSALAAIQQRGPGALTVPSHVGPPSGPTNLGRGQAPPPLPSGGAKTGAPGTAFDALRNSGSSASRNTSAAPPLGGVVKPGSSAGETNSLRGAPPPIGQFNRGVQVPEMRRANLGERSSPPPVPRRLADASRAVERSSGWGRPSMPSMRPFRTAGGNAAPAPSAGMPSFNRGVGGSAPGAVARASASAHPSIGRASGMGGGFGGGRGGH